MVRSGWRKDKQSQEAMPKSLDFMFKGSREP